ncbi:DUF3895 domain-containing protein [Paenibacillus aurantius]|uniref:DUF3895 domain-containing protein n=1 Tax=Paenibacillus aurantius TaxID=2918900 RepID=A0AA96RDX8_9BACL|nr:DUF3895 domain-containing protein [Paenibacillus aurantius]WJH36508.1 DUF3895 domain-containing protein [Paenibacillus sp. CC-CFT747]WNQ11845.1 DUF3895 domain-containing protein [Paenibacillus aurantius]
MKPVQFTMDDLFAPSPEPVRDPLESHIMTYINEGISSAREICEKLIARQGMDPARYSTGKPVLFPYVCRCLDSLASSGQVKFQGAVEGTEDRTYFKA